MIRERLSERCANWIAALRRVSIYRNIFESAICNVFLHAKYTETINRIDPNQGHNVGLDDVMTIHQFAFGQLTQLHQAGTSTSGTGLPLTDTERHRQKEHDKREREKKAADKVNSFNATTKGKGKKGGDNSSGTPPVGVAAGSQSGDVKKHISTTMSSWATPCKFWDSS